MGGIYNDHILEMCKKCPFLLPFSTRVLSFRLTNFDRHRTLYFLLEHFKSKSLNIPQSMEQFKIPRQKVKINRGEALENGIKVFKQYAKSQNLLEFEYFGEEGGGLGPTLEFYTLVANSLKGIEGLWRAMDDHSLFPEPIPVTTTASTSASKEFSFPEYASMTSSKLSVKRIISLFEFMGSLIAKSILDDRLIDLPLSTLFWDLLLGKDFNLWDLQTINPSFGLFIRQLQNLVEKKNIIEGSDLDVETKRRQIESLTFSVHYIYIYIYK